MTHAYTTHEEARRIIGKIRTAIFENHQSSCVITAEEYASLRNSLAQDIPEVGFTPSRTGVVALMFGGEVIVP